MTTRLRWLSALLLMALALPALAVYNQTVVVTGDPEVASADISFETPDGQAVPTKVEDEDDNRVVYVAFGGNSGRAGNLVLKYPDGRTQRIALPATSDGRTIKVNATTGLVIAEAPAMPSRGTAPGPGASVFYGYGDVEIASIASAGVISTAGGESPLQKTDDSLNVDPWGIQLNFPLGDRGWRMGVFYTNFSGDDDQHASSAPQAGGGVDNAIVLQQESATYGSGFFGGLEPLDSFSELKIDGDKFGVDLSWPCGHFPRVTGTLGIYYLSENIEQKSFDQFATVEVGTQRKAKVDSDTWVITAGGMYSYPFNDQLALNLFAGAMVQMYDAKLTSTQVIDFFGAMETLSKTDHDSDTAFGGYAGLSLSWNLGRFTVMPAAIIETGGPTAKVKYPTSGDEVLAGSEVKLDNESSTNWAMTLSIGMNF
jgi:hypothetical protein